MGCTAASGSHGPSRPACPSSRDRHPRHAIAIAAPSTGVPLWRRCCLRPYERPRRGGDPRQPPPVAVGATSPRRCTFCIKTWAGFLSYFVSVSAGGADPSPGPGRDGIVHPRTGPQGAGRPAVVRRRAEAPRQRRDDRACGPRQDDPDGRHHQGLGRGGLCQGARHSPRCEPGAMAE